MSVYISDFMNCLGGNNDPHGCWQDGCFDAEMLSYIDPSELYVWAAELTVSYLGTGEIIQYISCVNGRLLPEARIGYRALECPQMEEVCRRIMTVHSGDFPRTDSVREEFAYENETRLKALEGDFWDAWQTDRYQAKIEAYCRSYCERNLLR